MRKILITLAVLMAAMFVSNESYAQQALDSGRSSNESSSRPKAVDLGLSVKWADRNVGANAPEEYGLYYAWGETKAKADYSWSTYKWCLGETMMTKYNTDNYYGRVDNRTTLELKDDAAHANRRGSWRMPTKVEIEELQSKCKWSWTSQGGHEGYEVTGPNGNRIFLPAACYWGECLYEDGSYGCYWSSSLNADDPESAWALGFDSDDIDTYDDDRSYGYSVRPVKE